MDSYVFLRVFISEFELLHLQWCLHCLANLWITGSKTRLATLINAKIFGFNSSFILVTLVFLLR